MCAAWVELCVTDKSESITKCVCVCVCVCVCARACVRACMCVKRGFNALPPSQIHLWMPFSSTNCHYTFPMNNLTGDTGQCTTDTFHHKAHRHSMASVQHHALHAVIKNSFSLICMHGLFFSVEKCEGNVQSSREMLWLLRSPTH